MVDVGETAPDFTAPVAVGDDVEMFTLSDRLEETPIVLAFFPGAFTSVCTEEMCTFRNRLDAFDDLDATVYGLSTDSPFALNAFRETHDLGFGLISDANNEIVHEYDAVMDFEDLGIEDVAQRAVFIVDADGEVCYVWIAEHAGLEPEYDEVEAAAADATAA